MDEPKLCSAVKALFAKAGGAPAPRPADEGRELCPQVKALFAGAEAASAAGTAGADLGGSPLPRGEPGPSASPDPQPPEDDDKDARRRRRRRRRRRKKAKAAPAPARGAGGGGGGAAVPALPPGIVVRPRNAPRRPSRKPGLRLALGDGVLRKHSVFVYIFSRRGLYVLTNHDGELGVPGGKREARDHDLWAVAVREWEEEVGCPLPLRPCDLTAIDFVNPSCLSRHYYGFFSDDAVQRLALPEGPLDTDDAEAHAHWKADWADSVMEGWGYGADEEAPGSGRNWRPHIRRLLIMLSAMRESPSFGFGSRR
jgi:8-oxo-dGTP pyrophosphatase MutT (NUDIX family)